MWKNDKAFTLIEMLIVLTVITVLIILIIPNIANKSEEVHDTGCEALQETIQAQVSAYQLEKGEVVTDLQELENAGFITTKQRKCKNGDVLKLNNQGKVTVE